MERSGNPALRDSVFDNYVTDSNTAGRMTINGTGLKTAILLVVMGVTFGYSWHLCTQGYAEAFQADETGTVPTRIQIPPNVITMAMVGLFGGFVLAMIISFNPRLAQYLSAIYAALQGLALGAISAGAEARYPGIAFQAIVGTLGVFSCMLTLYTAGILRASPALVRGVVAATFGIFVLYAINMIMGFFGSYISVLYSNTPVAIGLQLLIVGVAALNLTLDFGTVEVQAKHGAPKYMEWYCAFALMVTIVWLYMEILRLLMKLRSRND
jgi:uncharacterized YccA/Bax inhibitor family protein